MEGVTTLPCGQCGSDSHEDAECPDPTYRPPPKHSFALGVPHTPWIPERVASMARLRAQLGSKPLFYREFDERESNRVWPTKLWSWGVLADTTHVLQIQDDVMVAPSFWPALRAMVEARPESIIGLHSNHPLARVQFQAGRRWYRDHWLTGPAYCIPTRTLRMFLDWCKLHPEKVADTNEDSLLSYWCQQVGIYVWHPVPAITDHDLGVPSTYGNDAHHEWSMYRQPPVTWRDVPSMDALLDPAYWRCTEASAPVLPGPGTQLCWFCAVQQGPIASQTTGARICRICLLRNVGAMMGLQVGT